MFGQLTFFRTFLPWRHPELRVHREGGPVYFNVKFIEKQ